MPASSSTTDNAIGFLTVVESPEHGLFGGYLLLNSTGRPLEFHCTTPVRPNRAQEILYGATLKPYLYGELLGKTLLSQTQIEPIFVCTNVAEVAEAREFTKVPLVLLLSADDQTDEQSRRVDGPVNSPTVRAPLGMVPLQLKSQQAAVSARHASDCQLMSERSGSLPESFDFREPFDRIRYAIEEAQMN